MRLLRMLVPFLPVLPAAVAVRQYRKASRRQAAGYGAGAASVAPSPATTRR
jgi:hypothetical protein